MHRSFPLPLTIDHCRIHASTMQDDEPVPSSVSSCALYGHTDSVVAVDIAPGCELVLSGSVDGCVRLWSPELQSGLVNFRCGLGFRDVDTLQEARYHCQLLLA